MKQTEPLRLKHYHAHMFLTQSEEEADVGSSDLQSPTVRKQAQGLENSLKEKAAIK